MLIRLTMKSADCVDQAVSDTVEDELCFLGKVYTDEDYHDTLDEIKEKVNNALSKWIRGQEYLTVIVDTETDTCSVVPNK